MSVEHPDVVPVADGDGDDPMSGAELRVVMRWLGLGAPHLAALLGVTERTVRHWVVGRYPIPDGVREEIEQLEAATAAAVEELVTALNDARDPAVATYRNDAAMHAARPGTGHLPVSWWDQVIARAAAEVPGLVIGYAP